MDELRNMTIGDLIDRVKAEVIWLEQGYSDATSEFDGIVSISNALTVLKEKANLLRAERDDYKKQLLEKIHDKIEMKKKLQKINELSSGI